MKRPACSNVAHGNAYMAGKCTTDTADFSVQLALFRCHRGRLDLVCRLFDQRIAIDFRMAARCPHQDQRQ